MPSKWKYDLDPASRFVFVCSLIALIGLMVFA